MINMKLKPTATNLIFILVLAALVIVFGPFAVVWALNTLVPSLAIPYTFETWLAVFLIKTFLTSNVSKSEK